MPPHWPYLEGCISVLLHDSPSPRSLPVHSQAVSDASAPQSILVNSAGPDRSSSLGAAAGGSVWAKICLGTSSFWVESGLVEQRSPLLVPQTVPPGPPQGFSLFLSVCL